MGFSEKFHDFIKRVEKDPEGQKVLSTVDRKFQFQGKGYNSFIIKLLNGKISMEEGKMKKPVFRELTVCLINKEDLQSLIDGKLSPADAFFSQKLGMTSEMSSKGYNYGLMRLIRRAQEL
jgi:hypothetical protein